MSQLLHNVDLQDVHSDNENRNLSQGLNDFFQDKVVKIRSTISGNLRFRTSQPLEVNRTPPVKTLDASTSVSVEEVVMLVSSLPWKSSPLDVLPTSLLKSSIKVFAPVLEHLVNLSFAESCFPLCFKTAQVQLRLKTPCLDRSDFANFRQISNLNTISKVIECLILVRLGPHFTKSTNFNQV